MKIRKNGRLIGKIGLLSLILTTSLNVTACGETSNISKPSKSLQTSNTPKIIATPVKTVAKKNTKNADPLLHGKKIYKRCKTCHTLTEGGKHRVGPNLWAVMGSQAGTREGFAYSKALKESDIVWNDDNLNAFLEKPSKYIPKNRMTFIGLKKEEDRIAVIEYIKSETTPAKE